MQTREENALKIGIIGAGNIGGALTRRFRELGHDVSVANSRGPQSLRALSEETGATAVDVNDAARGNDVVVVTIPLKNILALPKTLFADLPGGVVVIDTNNYYPQQRDGRVEGIEESPSESAWVASRLGHPVVKAFNNIYAEHLLKNGKPAGTPGRTALPVAGDDPKAKHTVMQLVEDLGFDAVDNGTIADSWRQQPGTPAYAKDFDAVALRAALASASPERQPQWKGTPKSPGDFENPR